MQIEAERRANEIQAKYITEGLGSPGREAWFRENRPERFCLDCKNLIAESYMICREIWEDKVPGGKGQLHLACFQMRLGRLIRIEDFTNAPVNLPFLYGYMIAKTENNDDTPSQD